MRSRVVPGDFGWTDIGDFHTLGDVLDPDADGNVVVGSDKGRLVTMDCTGTVVVPRSDRLVALVGLADTVVVDTPDVLLVCRRDRAQDVKRVVDLLKERGETDTV